MTGVKTAFVEPNIGAGSKALHCHHCEKPLKHLYHVNGLKKYSSRYCNAKCQRDNYLKLKAEFEDWLDRHPGQEPDDPLVVLFPFDYRTKKPRIRPCQPPALAPTGSRSTSSPTRANPGTSRNSSTTSKDSRSTGSFMDRSCSRRMPLSGSSPSPK